MQKYNVKIKFSLLISILYFILNYIAIWLGHFHEDAYILFIYVENIINGHDIAFYRNSPPAEGATDFLWLILLTALSYTGIDVGTSSIILNSIGVFIVTTIIYNLIIKSKYLTTKELALLLPFSALWLAFPPLKAALGGFSVYLYMAIVLLGYMTLFHIRYILLTPYISIIIALFRPDGVIIGIGMTLIGLALSIKNENFRHYLLGCFIATAIGIFYFIWRYNYFGNLLPLPLYVKSHGASGINGINDNLAWIKDNLFLLLPIILLSIKHKKLRRVLLLSAPVLTLFLILTFATQSQNVGFRFQAPTFIILYTSLIFLLIHSKERGDRSLTNAIILFLFIFITYTGTKTLWNSRDIVNFNYINQAPKAINNILPQGSTIALTEAGRMAFWNQAGNHIIIDLVGLNTEYPALNTIDEKYLKKLNPDIVMYHHANLLNIDALQNTQTPIIHLSGYTLSSFKNTSEAENLLRDQIPKVENASLTATDFLENNSELYDIVLVDYGSNGKFHHVYGVRKDINITERLINLLNKSFNNETQKSYFEMRNSVELILK